MSVVLTIENALIRADRAANYPRNLEHITCSACREDADRLMSEMVLLAKEVRQLQAENEQLKRQVQEDFGRDRT